MQNIGYYKVLCYLVSFTNDLERNDSELSDELLNICFSYYTNMLDKKDKINLISLGYDLLEFETNKHLLENLDNFKKVEYNIQSLKSVLHILEINL